MTFINREIIAEDRMTYRLNDTESSRPPGVLTPSRYWTVDQDRQIYLREVSRPTRGPESYPDPSRLIYQYHFYINKTTYLLSISKDASKEVLLKNDKHRHLKEYLHLTNISPMDESAKSRDFICILHEALGVSEGGNSLIAMLAIENGYTTHYEFEFNVLLED